MPVKHHPPQGKPPRTSCPSAGEGTVVEFGLTLVTVLVLLATGHSLEMALAIPVVALAGVRAVHTARISGGILRGLLGPWTAEDRPVTGPTFD